MNPTRRILTGLSGLALAIAGFAVGSASATGDTPQSCITALDDADKVIDLSIQALGYAADAMGAVSYLDVAEVEHATDGITRLTPQMESAVASYASSGAECRRSDS